MKFFPIDSYNAKENGCCCNVATRIKLLGHIRNKLPGHIKNIVIKINRSVYSYALGNSSTRL